MLLYFSWLSGILVSDFFFFLWFSVFNLRQFILRWFCFGLHCIILWTPGIMVSFLFLVLYVYFIMFCGHWRWWCHCFVYFWVLFHFFIYFCFKYLCEIMSNKCESKSRLKTRNDTICIKSLDSALINTLFVCST